MTQYIDTMCLEKSVTFTCFLNGKHFPFNFEMHWKLSEKYNISLPQILAAKLNELTPILNFMRRSRDFVEFFFLYKIFANVERGYGFSKVNARAVRPEYILLFFYDDLNLCDFSRRCDFSHKQTYIYQRNHQICTLRDTEHYRSVHLKPMVGVLFFHSYLAVS